MCAVLDEEVLEIVPKVVVGDGAGDDVVPIVRLGGVAVRVDLLTNDVLAAR